jgi:hypothetical protein
VKVGQRQTLNIWLKGFAMAFQSLCQGTVAHAAPPEQFKRITQACAKVMTWSHLKRNAALKALLFTALLALLSLLPSCEKKEASAADTSRDEGDVAHDESQDTTRGYDTEDSVEDDVDIADPRSTLPAELLWSKGVFCSEDYGGFDEVISSDYFLRTTGNSGSTQNEIVTTINVPLSPGGYPTAVWAAILNGRSGEEVECIALPEPRGIPSSRLIYDPKTDHFLYSYHYAVSDSPGAGSATRVDGVVGVGLAEDTPTLHEKSERSESIDGEKSSVLLKNGQFVTRVDSSRLESRDRSTGELLWNLSSSDLSLGDGAARITGVSTPDGTSLLAVAVASGTFSIVEVDARGQPTELYRHALDLDSRIVMPPMVLQDGIVLQFGGDTVVIEDWGGAILTKEEGCRSAITLGSSRLACLDLHDNRETGSIKAFDLDGSNKVVVPLQAPINDTAEPIPGKLGFWIIGGEADQVITAFESPATDSEGSARLFVLVANIRSKLVLPLSVVLQEPEERRGNTRVSPPLLTQSGTLIIPKWGFFYALETQLGGLAPGPYPRGVLLGGNSNRGYRSVD